MFITVRKVSNGYVVEKQETSLYGIGTALGTYQPSDPSNNVAVFEDAKSVAAHVENLLKGEE